MKSDLRTQKNVIWNKFFLRKMCFVDPKLAQKCPQNGPKWVPLGGGGSTGPILGFEGPRPFGNQNYAKKNVFENNILVYFWPKKEPGNVPGLGPNRPKYSPPPPSI